MRPVTRPFIKKQHSPLCVAAARRGAGQNPLVFQTVCFQERRAAACHTGPAVYWKRRRAHELKVLTKYIAHTLTSERSSVGREEHAGTERRRLRSWTRSWTRSTRLASTGGSPASGWIQPDTLITRESGPVFIIGITIRGGKTDLDPKVNGTVPRRHLCLFPGSPDAGIWRECRACLKSLRENPSGVLTASEMNHVNERASGRE